MSQGNVKSRENTELEDTLLRLIDFGPRLMSLSAERSRSFAQEAAGLLPAVSLPKLHIGLPRCNCPSCAIPEKECPPRCVCDLEWDACPGEKLQATITVRNTSSTARLFHFTSTVFQGPGNPNVPLTLVPTSANLAPNQAITITASFGVGANFQPGHAYHAEVLITGAYEQCVDVTLRVRAAAAHPHCDVDQGDMPKRIHAHQWYHHFQCEEACFPPPRQHGTVDSTVDANPLREG